MNASPERAGSVRDAILNVLDEAEVPFVLGMSGGNVGVLLAAVDAHPRVRAITVRQESIATTMAEAFGRLRARPLVVMGQGEWIVGNAGQGILEALLGSSPMVIITESSDAGAFAHHAPYQGGRGDYGSWDIVRALQGVTKRVMVSSHPAQAVQHVQLALKHAMTGDPGPVAVVLEESALRGPFGEGRSPTLHATSGYLPTVRREAAGSDVAAAAAVIRASDRPVVIAGNGVRLAQAYAELEAVARAIDAPVVTTAGGKGVFPELHDIAGGPIGTFGHRAANRLLQSADLVLAVGTRLASSDTGFASCTINPARQTLVHLDIEPLNVGWTQPVDHALVGDAQVVLGQLLAGHLSGPREASAVARVAAARRDTDPVELEAHAPHPPFAPQQVIQALTNVWPADGIVTCDAGENRLFMMQWFNSARDGGYLQPAGGGGMGYAVSSALGAKLAFPDRPVLAVCGDGGFAMSLHALMTAVEIHLPITVLVLNNRALGWVRHGSAGGADFALLHEFDHVAIAKAIGCTATSVESSDQLEPAITAGLASGLPHVIEVHTTLDTSFQDLIAL